MALHSVKPERKLRLRVFWSVGLRIWTDRVQVKNLERRTEEDVAYSAVAKYLISVLPRFQQMQRREQVTTSQDEPEEDLPEDSRQEGRRRYVRRHSERR